MVLNSIHLAHVKIYKYIFVHILLSIKFSIYYRISKNQEKQPFIKDNSANLQKYKIAFQESEAQLNFSQTLLTCFLCIGIYLLLKTWLKPLSKVSLSF
jgi:hypothetical protein